MKSYKIAITGGIGSGKSTALKIIEKLGYKVFDSDQIAAKVMGEDEMKQKIIKEFSLKIDKHNNYDKKELAKKVFSDKKLLKKLNEITHPTIIAKLFEKMDSLNQIVFAEVPLLFESGTQDKFDHILIIIRDEKKRIQAVVERSGESRESVVKKIGSQHNYKIKAKDNYTYIDNNGGIEHLTNLIKDFIKKIESMQNKETV